MIEVRGLVKRYGEKTALDGIDFSIKGGEIVGLLGLNGAGKSTAMNILTGYISPTAGSVRIDGHDILKEPIPAKRVTGYLPEQLAFYADMRVTEYLDFICDLKGYAKSKAQRSAHLNGICEKVGIAHIKRRLIRNLSKGYRQRVGLAQALVGDPKVLILDEPTVGLDPSQIMEIRKLIRELGKTATVIVSSHILTEIQEICSRVIVLREGRIVADGEPENLTGSGQACSRISIRVEGMEHEIIAALLSCRSVVNVVSLPAREAGTCDLLIEGAQGSDIRADIFRALAKADLPLLRTISGEHTLEDSFLNLVGARETGGEGI